MTRTRKIFRCRVLTAVVTLASLLTLASGVFAQSSADENRVRSTRSALQPEYRLGPGDVLAIDVFGLDDLDRKVRIARDGSVSLPLLGSFSLADRTLKDAEQLIASMLNERQLVINPQVSIFVEEFVSRVVSVQGAVGRPGVYPLVGNKTLLDLIGEAGGLSQDAGEKILVLRAGNRNGQAKIEIDIEMLSDQGDLSLNIFLLPKDVVMVQHAKELNVYVSGAVARPGAVSFRSSEGISVLQAITAAGGPTPRANLKKVHILRRLPDGTQERVKVSVSKIQKGKADDILLLKNDTVVVGEWFL